jgi:hypothetical protein
MFGRIVLGRSLRTADPHTPEVRTDQSHITAWASARGISRLSSNVPIPAPGAQSADASDIFNLLRRDRKHIFIVARIVFVFGIGALNFYFYSHKKIEKDQNPGYAFALSTMEALCIHFCLYIFLLNLMIAI